MTLRMRSLHQGLVTMVVTAGLILSTAVAAPAAAAAEGVINASQSVTKTVIDDDGEVRPGETFSYRIQFSCGTSIGDVDGCADAAIVDRLPEWIEYVGVSDFPAEAPGSASMTTVDGRDELTLAFTDTVRVPHEATGLRLGSHEMTIQVRLAADAPWELSGQVLTNTVALTSSNAAPVQDSADITPRIEPAPATAAAKAFSPTANFNTPGLGTTLTLSATNQTNGGVDTLIVQDPAIDTPPTDASSPFHHLAFTGFGDVVLPEGADAVEAEVYTASDGWVTVYSGAGPPVYPNSAPDVATIHGVRFVFSAGAGGIVRSATGTAEIELAQRPNVVGLPETTVGNTVVSTVTLGGTRADSARVAADYRIIPYGLQVGAAKTFDAAQIKAGESSTVRLGATNTGSAPLSTLTISEPGANTPGALSGELTFAGFTGEVRWPSGATDATVVYRYADGTASEPLSTSTADRLPGVPDGAPRVIGFIVTFGSDRSGIVTGAEATLPFTVTTERAEPLPDLVTVPNDVDVEGVALDDPDKSAVATASDDLEIYGDRIAVEVSKRITPEQAWLLPGQDVIAQIPARVSEFPATTVDPTRVVVTDSEVIASDWWNLYDATELTQLGIPAHAVLTVEYRSGRDWQELPGATRLTAPPAYRTVTIDPALSESITGLRFIYEAQDGTAFAPGTTFQPNITFTTRDTTRDDPDVDIVDVPRNATIPDPADPAATIPVVQSANCAVATARETDLGLDAVAALTDPCAIVSLIPVTGDGPDLVDKALSPTGLVERSQGAAQGVLRWSTGGLTGVAQQSITETGSTSFAPATAGTLTTSFFDSFDLVSLAPITTSSDPLMAYDRIVSVELFDHVAGAWKPVTVRGATSWDGATARGTVFPGYTLSAQERATTTGVRYLIEESPNRAVATSLDQPAKGSGVAASADRRPITLDFELRDVRRSDAAVPVLHADLYNAGTAGVVQNTVVSTACFEGFAADGACADGLTSRDADVISLLDGTATITTSKTWTGGPLGVPASGTPASDYPSTRATLSVTNNGPQKVDVIALSDPAPNTAFAGSAFDLFTLTGIVAISLPQGASGLDDTTVTLTFADGGTRDLNGSAALALGARDLADVVGIAVSASGRIEAGSSGRMRVQIDLQLRETLRHDPAVRVSATTVPNTLFGSIADPSVEPAGSCAPSDPGVTAPANTVIACATAQMVVQDMQERTVLAGKTFSPDAEQFEDEHDTFTTVLTGQPGGNARSNQLVLTDESPAFWNAYRFAGLASNFAIAGPAKRVQVEVLTDATYTVERDGSLTATGGSWRTVVGGSGTQAGTIWKSAAGAVAALPAGGADATVTLSDGATARYGEVQGVRFTYQRVAAASLTDPDAALLLFENPATPVMQARVQLERRETLVTGGAVPTTLSGNAAAPGTPAAGEYPNTVVATASGVTGNGTTVSDNHTASMWFRHLPTAVTVSKSPTGMVQPGRDFTVSLTTTNSGRYPIVDPVIVDTLPTSGVVAGLPDLVFPPDADPTDSRLYSFAVTGGTGPDGWKSMPVDASDVEITVTSSSGTTPEPVAIRFDFPESTALGIGESYVISWKMRVRPGSSAAQQFTNAFTVTGERDFDTCNGAGPVTDVCGTSATVSVQPLGNLAMTQSVRADDSELGVISSTSRVCTPADADAEGFYVTPCAPVTKPGGTDTWRLSYQNTGTYPLDSVSSVVYLPLPGRSGIDIPSALSEWLPQLLGEPVLAAAPGATLTTYYSTADPQKDLCDAVLDRNGSCAPGYWQELTGEADLRTVTMLYVVVDFAGGGVLLPPGGTFDIRFQTRAAASAVNDGTDPITWNSAKTGARYTSGGVTETLLPFEVPVVGASLATGSLSLVKKVTGEAADQDWVPGSFGGRLECISAGEPVPTEALPTVPALKPGEEVTLSGLPWGASCGFVETEAGSAVTLSPASVIATAETAGVELQTVTNRYEYASLTVRKSVTAATGFGVPTGFGFAVVCTYLGEEVLDVTFTLDQDGSRTFDGLPARAECTVTETDPRGADDTIASVQVVSPTAPPVIDQDGREVRIPQLSPDGSDGAVTNTVVFDNLYDVAGLTITKSLQGAGAAQFGAERTFVAVIMCVFRGERLVDTMVELNAGNGWSASVPGVVAGAECLVTEPDRAGADAVAITPNDGDATVGHVTLPASGAAQVEMTNWYLTGGVEVTKVFAGDAAAQYGTADFEVQLACVRDGQDVLIPGGGVRTVSADAPTAGYTNLPTGAECTLTETRTGGAGASATLSASGDELVGDATAGYTFTVSTDSTVLSVDDQAQPALQVQNSFAYAELSVSKTVESDAVDAAGDPVSFGPFEASLVCTFNGAGVAAVEPMTRSIADGETVTWTGLPEGADCAVTESDAAGASRTTAAVTQSGVTGPAEDGAAVVLDPLPAVDAPAQSSVAFVNVFDVASLSISKKLTGSGAGDVTRTFPVDVVCELVDASHPDGLVVLEETVRIGGRDDLTASFGDIPLGASCTVTETDTGGAVATSISTRVPDSPEGATTVPRATATVTLVAPETAVVVTNTFHAPLPATGLVLGWVLPLGSLLLLLVGALLVSRRRRS
ncbi:DUF5979 domain-containing protein [Microbacterium caowuchunii]|uniref:Gram-positive cocci surface proteins LPxTG domain-containing protein n=1 Tax=Microbacterium caowuchunii TaxID=2614638 RepID=A0A5N0TET2_9MICO|nr:DUF5979 domain-containing protein [Microbacterium caowuchunii]KAA9132386.1 hypothetical protein F6B40_11910 [Microbacterium caowuchunii]